MSLVRDMDLGDALTTVQQNVTQVLLRGGTGIYFAVLLFCALVLAFFKAVSDALQEKLKEAVKAHLLSGTIVCLGLALSIFSRQYVTATVAAVAGAGWLCLNIWKPAYARLTLGCLLAAVFVVSYAGERYVQRRRAPAYTYAVLSFENYGVGDRDIMVSSWGRFKQVLADVFAGAASVHVEPDSVKPEVFDALEWGSRSPTQIISALGGSVTGRQIVLRNDVSLTGGTSTRLMKLVSEPHRLAKKQLLALGVLDVPREAVGDIDHVALSVAVALVDTLQDLPDFSMTPQDKSEVMKRILKHYVTFLRLRDPAYRGVITDASKLAQQDPVPSSEVEALLSKYTGPAESADPDKAAGLARHSQLEKLRINRGRGDKVLAPSEGAHVQQ